MRVLRRFSLAFLFATLGVTAAAAQTYPSRPIRLVVPFAAGGPADFLGRVLGQKLGETLGQQIVVDNRPGANTILGAQAVARADPDGYTLLMAIDGTLVMNPFLYSKLSYDALKDITPIAEIYPGYDLGIWQSIVAPAGISREAIGRLSAAIKAVLSDQELRQKILNAGIEPAFSNSPQEFAAFVRAQAETRSKVIRAIGLKLD
jgi:tripartite-type tricarboxylate transporter receptor subunit TctC